MTKRDASGNIIYNKDPNMLYDSNGNAVRTVSNSDTPILNGLGTAANSTGKAIGAVGSGVGNLIGGTIGTVGGVANNIISTTGSIANNLIDGSQSLGSGYGNGTAMNRQGTAGYTTGDVQRNLGYGGVGYPATNTQYNTATFPYYGANPPSTSTFMPITTDFSAFAK
jgi:hypothetical protein